MNSIRLKLRRFLTNNADRKNVYDTPFYSPDHNSIEKLRKNLTKTGWFFAGILKVFFILTIKDIRGA